jgi:nicotinamidase-related amidase
MSVQPIPPATVEVPEITFVDALDLPATATAIVIVDMQNDFVDPAGALSVRAASATVERIGGLLQRARASGVHIAYTQDTHIEGDVEWDVWPDHTRQDTWGWQIIPALAPQPGDLVCRKNRYDGFYGTWLDHYLSHIWRVAHVVVVGTVSNICVLHTAASAGLRYFRVIVPADGISALTDFDQAMALRQISWLYGGSVLRSADDIAFTARSGE